jgi:hypothetical protein
VLQILRRYGAACLFAALACSSCSPDASPAPLGIDANKVCDGLFKDAPTALHRVTGVTELRTDTFRIESSVSSLNAERGSRPCLIYPARNSEGRLLLGLSFLKRETAPTKETWQHTTSDTWHVFALGAHARTTEVGAKLYFRCSRPESSDKDAYLFADMRLHTAEAASGASRQRERDKMKLLNAASRQIAAEIGCLDEAALPPRVPSSWETWQR